MELQNDHDLLVTLIETVRQVKDEIVDLKDNVKSQIFDHEKRIRVLESDKWKTAGVVGFSILVITLLVTYFSGHHLTIN
jgi:hypothetical protein